MGPCLGSAAGTASDKRTAPKPGKEEVILASRLNLDGAPVTAEPPFCAIVGSWLTAWLEFVQGEGPPPGPIPNASLVLSSGSGTVEQVVWICTDDWNVLRARHGGGPALLRETRDLFPHPPAVQSRTTDPEALIHAATSVHAARCGVLESDLAAEMAWLQQGPWAPQRPARKRWRLGGNDKAVAYAAATAELDRARKGVAQALADGQGAENLRSALRTLRDLGREEDLGALEVLALALCAHEEAQTVLSCLLQALKESDRVGLEMWLEQADAMGIEPSETPLLGPLGQYVSELETRERRALEDHAREAEDSKEGGGARVWRLSIVAYEAEDEDTLVDLMAEAQANGINSSGTKMLLEQLREKRAEERHRRIADEARERAAAGAQHGNGPGGFNSHFFWRSSDGFSGFGDGRQREAEGRGVPPFQGRWTQTDGGAASSSSGRVPSWDDPDSWNNTEDFLNAWRRKRAQEDAERQRREAEWRWQQQQRRQRQASLSSDYVDTSSALRTLGLPPGRVPPLQELKAAYKTAAMRAHPDRPHNRGRQQQATAEFQAVKAAFDHLAQSARP
eukprot:gnl/TRDRNA2_/TRDRNA2_89897_c0_seq1.p1 gnl/TRDRNA2_/TRDRNA2_89897_c0~~gnl/TRDRNA2_/TRDRNA2_89897_c0_seq1.p1  ORF type:complete len:565 (-),score=90.19 gnl/TRDRNA2_/TRDRNA2_89897_c0_seq1:49-1743(-)